MNRADEKRAFEAMMDEISDSDDEELKTKISVTSKAQSKTPSANAYGKDYKQSNNSSTRSTPTPPLIPKQYKMSKEEEEIENFGSQTPQDEIQAQAEQLSVTKRWLSRPCSKGDRASMKCYIERERGFGVQTTYRCYLEGSDGSAPRFMMAAKKKAAKQTSYYLVSLDINPDNDRGSDTVLGKVRGNAIGSKYIIADHGLAPEKTVAPSMLRKEHGVISFEFDSGGPSRIEAWVPAVSSSGVVSVWQPLNDSQSMEAKIDGKDFDNMLYLQNKTPKWDEAHGGHVLNFQGRVTESSVKNFQLCCHELEDPDEVVLQFGRVGKHKFTMDLKYPLSPLQAFSISIACLDGKIADRKGYEYIKKFTGGGGSSSASSANDLPDLADTNDGREKTGREQQARGSMTGNSTMLGSFREAIPSTQYLRDKITRTFK